MKDISKIQEKRVAKSLNGRVQPGSGAVGITSLKADVTANTNSDISLLVECKTKASPGKSIILKREWLEKVEQECKQMGRTLPAVAISFDNKTEYYVIKGSDFKWLLDLAGGVL
jgi:hypothetical protein